MISAKLNVLLMPPGNGDEEAGEQDEIHTTTTTTAAGGTDVGGGLTMKECSAKYQAAKSAGTLGGLKWNDFRKAQCSADFAAAPASPTKTSKTATNSANDNGGLTMKECSAKYQAAKSAGTLGCKKWNDFRKAQCSTGGSTTANQQPAQPDDDRNRAIRWQ